MKRNDIPILIATAAFSFLFYRQTEGVNYFLFSLLMLSLLIIRDFSLLFSRSFLAAATGYVTASFCLFYYGNSLSFVAAMISMLLVAGLSFDSRSSIFVAGLHSVFSMISVLVYILIDITRNLLAPGDGRRTGVLKKSVLAVIPMAIFLMFALIYISGNPIFAHFASYINFDFISIGWCFFTVWGFFFCYAFFKQRNIDIITAKDHGISDQLPVITAEDHARSAMAHILSVPSEVYTGVVMLALLNLLLAAVNGLDIFYLGIVRAMPAGVNASQYVHNGTNSLIASIILAVCILLFYFKGYLNYYSGSKWLKNLAYLWIAQNIVLVLSTAYRNAMYIGNYGLTEKRIGVYVYLILCVAGLVTTFIKIFNVRNTLFLFRKNGWIAYAFLICACPFDWDSIITDYDISRFQDDRTMEIDQRYLADLGYPNLATLFKYYIVDKKVLHAEAKSEGRESSFDLGSSSSSSGHLYYNEIDRMIWLKYLDLKEHYADHHWQSHCMSKSKNLHEVERMIQENNLSCPVNLR